MDRELYYLKRAMRLAQKAGDAVFPNPKVGAVLVLNDQVVSEGFHACYGDKHAERIAIDEARMKSIPLQDATLYCSLEPCVGTWKGKKQESCVSLIQASGIRKICIGSLDWNKKVRGKGLRALEDAGIKVSLYKGLEMELFRLNEVFAVYMQEKRPFVHLKIAQSLDARVATNSGASRWITGSASRKEVHRIRAGVQAIISSRSTVQHDRPRFDVRHGRRKNPALVILDSKLRSPPDAALFAVQRRQPSVLLYHASTASKKQVELFKKMDTELCEVTKNQRGLDLLAILQNLKKRNLYSLLLECGPRLASSFLEQGLVDKISFFIAAKIIGGKYSSIQTRGADCIEQIQTLYATQIKKIKNPEGSIDSCVSGYLRKLY